MLYLVVPPLLDLEVDGVGIVGLAWLREKRGTFVPVSRPCNLPRTSLSWPSFAQLASVQLGPEEPQVMLCLLGSRPLDNGVATFIHISVRLWLLISR